MCANERLEASLVSVLVLLRHKHTHTHTVLPLSYYALCTITPKHGDEWLLIKQTGFLLVRINPSCGCHACYCHK